MISHCTPSPKTLVTKSCWDTKVHYSYPCHLYRLATFPPLVFRQVKMWFEMCLALKSGVLFRCSSLSYFTKVITSHLHNAVIDLLSHCFGFPLIASQTFQSMTFHCAQCAAQGLRRKQNTVSGRFCRGVSLMFGFQHKFLTAKELQNTEPQQGDASGLWSHSCWYRCSRSTHEGKTYRCSQTLKHMKIQSGLNWEPCGVRDTDKIHFSVYLLINVEGSCRFQRVMWIEYVLFSWKK